MKKLVNILLFILSFIWQAPQSILGFCFLLFFVIRGDIELISYKKLCFAFKSKYMNGGISLGNFAFLSTYNAKKTASVAHEQEGHTKDSKIFGPLYLLIIGLPSLMWAWLGDNNKCYYDFYTERRANKHANLEVLTTASGYCFLSPINVLSLGK
jgi:hypothetical protein